MRIELLDSKYLEQRKINEAKTTERAFAGSAEITANLARFAKKRTDIFVDEAGALKLAKQQQQQQQQQLLQQQQQQQQQQREVCESADLCLIVLFDGAM